MIFKKKTYFEKTLSHIRLGVSFAVVISPSLGTAVSALGRLLLVVSALLILLLGTKPKEDSAKLLYQGCLLTIFLAVGYLALSSLWADINNNYVWSAWLRHARLLSIPLLYVLIYSYKEARLLLRVFVLAQLFVVFSSWLLVAGVTVPWATSRAAVYNYSVFGTYLEQSISQAVLVAILWHQRHWILGDSGRWWAIALAAITLVHTLGFLIGLSGHLVALGLIILAIMYELPKRFKWTIVLLSVTVLAIAFAGSQNFRARAQLVQKDIQTYSEKYDTTTSSGQRLFYWQTSLRAITEKPLLGYGSGSWNMQYRRFEGGRSPVSLTVSDPHQLFLLWAVEGGLVGVILLCAVFFAIYRRSRALEKYDARTLQSVLGALIISGMFNSMIFGIGMGDFFCVGLGICLALARRQDQPVVGVTLGAGNS
jgi:O-antigen ligase